MRLSPAVAALSSALVALALACTPQRKLCDAESECSLTAACVAGRCVPEAGAPLVTNAQRIVAEPLDVACLTPSASNGARMRADRCVLNVQDARIYMQFAVDLPPTAEVVEAYLLFTPVEAVDGTDGTVRLRALRVTEPWDGRSTSWASRPRTEVEKTAFTRGRSGGAVRVDVLEIVRQWRQRGRNEHGVAVTVDQVSRGGMAFALGAARDTDDSEGPLSRGPIRGPILELYVK